MEKIITGILIGVLAVFIINLFMVIKATNELNSGQSVCVGVKISKQ